MKKVLVVTTGGTIGMITDPESHASIIKDSVDLLSFNELRRIAEIEHIEFSNIPSPQMTPELMWELSKLLKEKLKEDIEGIVVTHGTDTLEETAYFLDLILDTYKPVVITAAMRNSDEIGSDGPRNIFSSVRVVLNKYSKNQGVLVCLNDEIHAAREVTKTYTSNVATFDSPGHGPLGIVDEDAVLFFRKSILRCTLSPEKIQSNVALIKTFTGDNGDILDYVGKKNYSGIVLESFGRGNVPPAVSERIIRIIKEKNIPVVITSRCWKGRVLGIYGYTGGGKELQEAGAVFAQELSSQKARIRLIITLGISEDLEIIKGLFKLPFKE